jgi:cell filamentation protein
MNRYKVHTAEGEYQAGSDGRVLKNLLGITSPEEMDEVELGLLIQLYESVLMEDLPVRALTVEDLKTWHRRWLGNVYEWAGQERSVNMGKGGFAFAAAGQIPRLLEQFERDCLKQWTPCGGLDINELVQAITMTHVELILIHPFREGNGRLSRLLADVMAVQAGHDPLDYSAWETNKDAYIGAIHQGVRMDFEPMKHWVCVAMGLAEGRLTPPA